MRKVTTYQLIEGIKRNLALIIVPTILVFALVLGLGLKKNGGTYEASAVLIASPEEGEEISYNKLILNEKLANIYSEIIKSPDLYKKAEETLKKGGSDLDYKELMAKTDFEVSPQAGLLTLNFTDTNEARAEDALKIIAEDFRLMVKEYLNADNLSYLQDVLVEKASKKRLIIFSVAGAILGAFLGLVIVIIKTLLSDKIVSEKDLRELGLDVLATSDEILKIKAKIDYRLEDGIIGITSLAKADSYEFSEKLTNAFAKNNGVLFVDSKNVANIEGKYQSQVEEFKVLRRGPIDYLALSKDDSEKILDSNEFFSELANRENSYNYIIIDEKNLDRPDPYLTARLCDMKLILVDEKTTKSRLDEAIKDLRELGIGYCGVVFYK